MGSHFLCLAVIAFGFPGSHVSGEWVQVQTNVGTVIGKSENNDAIHTFKVRIFKCRYLISTFTLAKICRGFLMLNRRLEN